MANRSRRQRPSRRTAKSESRPALTSAAPGLRAGRPAVKGISADILWEHEQSGETIGEIAGEYGLSDEDVRWAIACETSARDRHIQDHRAEIKAARSSGARMVNLVADDATDRFAQMEVSLGRFTGFSFTTWCAISGGPC